MLAMIRLGPLNAAICAVVQNGGKESDGQQVDGIPDAMAAQNSIQHRQNGHSHPTGYAAFHTCRYRIDFEGQVRPGQLAVHELDALDLGAAGAHALRDVRNLHRFHFLVRQDITEPADVPAHGQDCPQNADGSVRDQAGDDQHDAEGQDDRPHRWCWRAPPCPWAWRRFRLRLMFQSAFLTRSNAR